MLEQPFPKETSHRLRWIGPQAGVWGSGHIMDCFHQVGCPVPVA